MKVRCGSDVMIKRGAAKELAEYVKKYTAASRVLVVTDDNVARLYLDGVVSQLQKHFEVYEFVFEAGEKSKTVQTYLSVVNALAEHGFNRSDAVVALGGGVVGDVAGYAAATYMRGIGLVQVPTTLLAMIDSSIGGKTGVDLPQGKNLLGAFYAPSLVLIDVDFLKTLGADEMKNGMGEGVKYACLMGGEVADIVMRGVDDLERFVYLCAKFKAEIVNSDAKEANVRRLLNFGHTVGHALERISGYALSHGAAVAKGVAVMAKAAYILCEIDREEYERVGDLLEKCGFERSADIPLAAIIEAISSDKKAIGKDGIFVVKFGGLGNCRIEKTTIREFERYIGVSSSAKVRGSRLFGRVSAPLSKSEAHRELIACALAGKLHDVNCCDDVCRTREALEGILGNEADVRVDVGESGSTLRFLIPLAGALNKKVSFLTRGRLIKRPLDALADCMRAHGVFVTTNGNKIRAQGQLCGGEFEIDGSLSSQFVTGLLFALPLLKCDSVLKVKGEKVSSGYIDMTLATLERHGVRVERREDGFFVPGGQTYKNAEDVHIRGDWSAGAILLAAGALAGDITVDGLDENSLQGDKVVLDIYGKAGAKLSFEDGVHVRHGELSSLSFDGKDCPDVIPTAAVLLAFAKGTSKISGVSRLRLKECDRLCATMDLLEKMGVRSREIPEDDALEIEGGKPHCGVFDGRGDHRIAMSAVVAALATEGESVVLDADCVSKSYPGFFEAMRTLGTDVELRH